MSRDPTVDSRRYLLSLISVIPSRFMVASLAFPSDTAADLTQGLFALGNRTRLARLFGTSSRCITAFASMRSLFNYMFLAVPFLKETCHMALEHYWTD
jgi:hypothetical protein